jgi:hypothetical protein
MLLGPMLERLAWAELAQKITAALSGYTFGLLLDRELGGPFKFCENYLEIPEKTQEKDRTVSDLIRRSTERAR